MRKTVVYIGILLMFGLLLSTLDAMADSNATSTDTIRVTKSIESYNYDTGKGVLSLENFIPGAMGIVSQAKALDAILVLDYSSSMNDDYGVDSTYTKVVASKKYAAGNLYYKKNTYLSNYETPKTPLITQIYYDSSISKPVKFNGQNVSVIYIVDPNFVSQMGSTTLNSRCWAYITVGGKRVFIREDGTTVEEKGSTTVAWATFPQGVDGFPIVPAYHDNEGTIFTEFTEATDHTTKRYKALQFAVGKFIDLVADHAQKSGKTDRVSIVVFHGGGSSDYPTPFSLTSDKYLTDGSLSYLSEWPSIYKATGGERDWISRSYVAKRFTDITSLNAVRSLKYAVAGSDPKGNTAVDHGLNIATELMNKSGRTGDDVARYVIVFSDGEPTQTSGDVWSSGQVAERAVTKAYELKNSSKYKSIYYTIYCHSDDPSEKVDLFMDHLSSNYPYAKQYNDNTKKLQGDEAKYYKTAKTNLAKIFEDISKEITIITVNSKYDKNTKLTDIINGSAFKLQSDITSDNVYDKILVYKNECAAYDSTTNVYTWSNTMTRLTKSDGINLSITKNNGNDKVELTGFDFATNWCGHDVKLNKGRGYRLIFKIPFEYNGSEISGKITTNANGSGVQVKKSGSYVEDAPYISPTQELCSIVINRSGLENGENAIYKIEKTGGTYTNELILKGDSDGSDSKSIFGLAPGEYKVTETGWNWAYKKDSDNPQTKATSSSNYVLTYDFSGGHKETTETSDPAKENNHYESTKVNTLSLP